MRPLRFLLTITACVLGFFFVLFIGPFRQTPTTELEQSHISAYFNWRTPSSLFPPSAIISLTDDNSTFFLARPAAFGPLLPVKSLSGQLWVGSGFGDDHLGRSVAGGAEGELGCSDVLGWSDGEYSGSKKVAVEGKVAKDSKEVGKERPKRTHIDALDETEGDDIDAALEDDGTDDHLHHPLASSEVGKTTGAATSPSKKPGHADIQSLQESAEIAGKVVLLSRGGCGFLEKAKWVQRRGGVALLVGDDIRGGPLVTMYARGDTSNITIPALFTSHTTAHLLSSLIPHGGSEDLSSEDAARQGLILGDKAEAGESSGKKTAVAEKPNFTSTTTIAKAASTAKASSKGKRIKTQSKQKQGDVDREAGASWIWSLLGAGGSSGRGEDSRRPPSSGNMDWVLQEDFEEDIVAPVKAKAGKATQSTTAIAKHAPTKKPGNTPGDGFIIGVQDWRDADLVAEQREQQVAGSTSSSTSQAAAKSTKAAVHGPKGGSIIPGSGEYGKAIHYAIDVSDIAPENDDAKFSGRTSHQEPEEQDSRSWLRRVFSSSSNKNHDETVSEQHAVPATSLKKPAAQAAHAKDELSTAGKKDDLAEHDGLWVTLSPTSMSSSSFFDTLLVLVVSPLVTLTVVYAMLLLRSRIRRRRWRAPKSVVERLPVRTYQTMATSTIGSSPLSSAASSPDRETATATTPLLPSSASPTTASRPIRLPRPRSRTQPAVPTTSSSAPETLPTQALAQDLSQHWRRKQRECVVCLEEYIDGISRVMSLPCGHEFHEGCITPWLVNRRRTCPICKGDVVRSLGSSASVRERAAETPYRDDVEEEQLVSVALVREEGGEEDLERGRE